MRMSILEAILQLRDDIKLWVTNNFNAKVGNTDISKIGDGTTTGAISNLNANINKNAFDIGVLNNTLGDLTNYEQYQHTGAKHSYILSNVWISKLGNLVILTIDTGIQESAMFPQGSIYDIIYGLPKPRLKAISTLRTHDGTISAYIDSNNHILSIDCTSIQVNGYLHGQIVYFTD